MSPPVLSVSSLEIGYEVEGRPLSAVRDLSFEIAPGESYGLVGESGSGKTTAALAVARYLPPNGRVLGGEISFEGEDLLAAGGRRLRELRAKRISMVYQEPVRALNPSIRVGRQVAEAFEVLGSDRSTAEEQAVEMLTKVRIPAAGRLMRRYPHELSGGMAQRVVIAMALACDPALLILDEPTTSLDVTVEAEVLELVTALRQELGSAVLFITHNLAIIARMCERVGVLYSGELVESGRSEELFSEPRHPYTVGLVRCLPSGERRARRRLETIPGFLPPLGSKPQGCIFADRCGLVEKRCVESPPPSFSLGDERSSRCFRHEVAGSLPRLSSDEETPEVTTDEPHRLLARLESVSKSYRSKGEELQALVGIDLDLFERETLGLVGESGSGKTTLARVIAGLTSPEEGSRIELLGEALPPSLPRRNSRQLKDLQLIFQNPDSALNRRHSVARLIGESVRRLAGLRKEALREKVEELASSVRMERRHLSLRPSQLSGGLKQRVAIARAFAGSPRLVVCDEPTSALDVSVQAAIVNLLGDLQDTEGVSYLFISHDLSVVRYIADRIAVMYLGRLMEVGSTEQVFAAGRHPYSEALLSAVAKLGEAASQRALVHGDIPSATSPPTGCVFHTRCPRRLTSGLCEESSPPLVEVEPGHYMSCHIPLDILREEQSRLDSAETAVRTIKGGSGD